MNIRYDRLILQLGNDELEQFCRSWVLKKSGYTEVKRYGGAGDKGRDVVGFLTTQRHQGPWDNYQCKQYRTGVSKGQGLLAVGKVLYWASRGEFSVPRKFYFVAPKGVAGKLRKLIDNPTEFKAELTKTWNENCATSIAQGQKIPLDSSLNEAIEQFSFHEIHVVDVDEMLEDAAVKPLLFEKYGADPGQYPSTAVPAEILPSELPYLSALVEAYNEREGAKYKDHDSILADVKHGEDMRMHRVRYFEADGFQRFYRDNSSAKIIDDFRRDIRYGVNEKWKAAANDSLSRVDVVMAQASTVSPAGPVSKYANVPVKQGICHHFVNDGEMTWKLNHE